MKAGEKPNLIKPSYLERSKAKIVSKGSVESWALAYGIME